MALVSDVNLAVSAAETDGDPRRQRLVRLGDAAAGERKLRQRGREGQQEEEHGRN